MMSSQFTGSALLALALAAAPFPLQAQETGLRIPPGQGESGPAPVAPSRSADERDGAPERAQQAQDAGEPRALEKAPERNVDRDDDLERARAAARAADPRLQGLERAREAARRSQDQNGAKNCLSAREARGAILAKRAVTLSQALRAARDAWDGEVIDYKLCTFDGVLAYDLTLLNTAGRVARVRVAAADGKLVNVR